MLFVYCYNHCHGYAVKGFWALWDNIFGVYVITVAMEMLLRDCETYGMLFMVVFTAVDFPIILDRQFTGYFSFS
jgi:hypothetical protein